MLAFINDQFLEEDKVSLRVSDLSIQRGYAVFDFLRTKDHVPVFIDNYLDRFYNSISMMRLTPLHTKEQLKAIIHELIRRNGLTESGIKVLLTGGYSPDSYELARPNLVITQVNIQMITPARFEEGIKIISHEYQRDLPEVKSINYLMGIWLQQKIKDQGAADVLYHKQGIVTECPRSNIFIVTADEKVVTPAANVLPGITRMKVLELAAEKFRTETRDLQLDEIRNAAEIFMTSTTKRLLPVVRVDDKVIGNGKAGSITRELNEEFVKMEDRYVSSYR